MNSNNKGTYLLLTAMFALTLSAFIVMGVPNAPTGTTTVSSSSRNLSTLATQSVEARGGNVTEINIQALTITQSWQGYYGDITGTVSLQNANNFTFYNWSVTTVTGEVYATRNSTIVWTRINCSNATQRAAEETYLGQVPGDSDSVTNTFNKTAHPAITVGSTTVAANSCYSTNGFVNNATQNASWWQILLNDNVSIVYSTLINDSVAGFDSANHDFQLLVGENEKAGSIGVTTYYFWVELN